MIDVQYIITMFCVYPIFNVNCTVDVRFNSFQKEILLKQYFYPKKEH